MKPQELPKHLRDNRVINMIVAESSRTPFVQRVTLFGSHARGAALAESDYDLMFECDQGDLAADGRWGEFAAKLRERNPTLNTLDLVRSDLASHALLEEAKKNGVVLYAR